MQGNSGGHPKTTPNATSTRIPRSVPLHISRPWGDFLVEGIVELQDDTQGGLYDVEELRTSMRIGSEAAGGGRV